MSIFPLRTGKARRVELPRKATRTHHWRCPRCGSDRLEGKFWTDVNTEIVVCWDAESRYRCPRCKVEYPVACYVRDQDDYCFLDEQPFAECKKRHQEKPNARGVERSQPYSLNVFRYECQEQGCPRQGKRYTKQMEGCPGCGKALHIKAALSAAAGK